MASVKTPAYRYENVTIVSIYDADTLTLLVDLGFNIRHEISCRLARINAWEVRGKEKEEGIIARDYLRKRLSEGSFIIETFKAKGSDAKGKYGRFLVLLYDRDGVCINDELVSLGHAKYQEY